MQPCISTCGSNTRCTCRKIAEHNIVEKEAEEEQQQRALKGAYRSFVIPGTPKTDIHSYFDQTKPHVKTLIKNQLKEMGSAKIIMTLWVRWKKRVMPLIELGPGTQKMLRTWMMASLAITTSGWRCHLTV